MPSSRAIGALRTSQSIVAAVDLPVNADFMSGYGLEPEDVAESVTRCIATGVAGLSIEDSTGDPSAPLFDLPVAVKRIRAARWAIDQSGEDVLLTARAECYHVGHPHALSESIRRLQAYAEAGADVLFAPGPHETSEITALVEAVRPKPFNLLVVRDTGLSVGDIANLGVRRISVGGALALAAWTGFMHAAETLKSEGSFAGLASLVPYTQINGLFAAALQGVRQRDGKTSERDMSDWGRSLSLGRRLKVLSSAGFAWPNQSTNSGADRRVSIRTTSATSRTRARDIADRCLCGRGVTLTRVTTRLRNRSRPGGHGDSEHSATAVGGIVMDSTAALPVSQSPAGGAPGAREAAVHALLSKDLAGVAGRN